MSGLNELSKCKQWKKGRILYCLSFSKCKTKRVNAFWTENEKVKEEEEEITKKKKKKYHDWTEDDEIDMKNEKKTTK